MRVVAGPPACILLLHSQASTQAWACITFQQKTTHQSPIVPAKEQEGSYGPYELKKTYPRVVFLYLIEIVFKASGYQAVHYQPLLVYIISQRNKLSSTG